MIVLILIYSYIYNLFFQHIYSQKQGQWAKNDTFLSPTLYDEELKILLHFCSEIFGNYFFESLSLNPILYRVVYHGQLRGFKIY